MKNIWSGLKTMADFRPANAGGTEGMGLMAHELNVFFNRFDSAAASIHHCFPLPCLLAVSQVRVLLPLHYYYTSSGSQANGPHPDDKPSSSPSCILNSVLHLTSLKDIWGMRKLNSGKAAGPDGASPETKPVPPQLCGVLHSVFTMSLSLQSPCSVEDILPRSCAKHVPS